jgi:tetratricopeptide (TPR) repeat protein
MYRQVRFRLLQVVFLCCACAVIGFAQDINPHIQATPPPTTRAIQPPSENATAADLEKQGDVLRAQKAYLDSIDYYRAAIKRLQKEERQKVSGLYNKLGMSQVQMGRYNDAKHTFQKAAKIDKTNFNAINNAGSMFYHQKKWGKAIKLYRKAIDLSPDNAPFHANLGSAYIAHKELARGDAEYLAALQLDPDVFEYRSTVGIAALMSPEDRAKFSYTLAKMYAKDGQMDRALLYLRRAMEEGYKDIDHVYEDNDFAALRKDQRFVALMAQPPVAITGREQP